MEVHFDGTIYGSIALRRESVICRTTHIHTVLVHIQASDPRRDGQAKLAYTASHVAIIFQLTVFKVAQLH